MWLCIRFFCFTKLFKNCLIFSSVTLLFIGLVKLFCSREKRFINFNCTSTAESLKYFHPVVRIHGIQDADHSLDVVKDLFEKMGYRIDTKNSSHWDVLWSHTYPFGTLANELAYIKVNQKVNHFPGTGYITQKSNLKELGVKSLPKSFTLPFDKGNFLKYAEQNPELFWVVKNSDHRGIHILNGTEELTKNGSIIQEFIKNPFVINRKKFDIGVYVMITSIDPLRVYVYSSDVLLRFCTENYHPLNIHSVESYIVGDNYLPIWKVPDLNFFYSELNYTAKESLNAYIQSQGKSSKRMWSQIHEIIRDVYFKAEEYMKKRSMILGHLRNYFELVRFDFVVDENLNVFLLEVNMSPNLSPAHFPQNRLLYEQIIFNSLSLVGLVRKFPAFFMYRGEADVSEKDFHVFAEQCISETCQNSCRNFKCKVCTHCVNREWKDIMRTAFLEFMNRGKYRRIIPVVQRGHEKRIEHSKLSEMNSIMDLWFKGKCLQDEAWCQ